jgi:hypothetical protein
MRFLVLLLSLFLPVAAHASSAGSFTDVRAQTTAVFASGTASSAEVDLGGTEIVGLQMPATFTGSAMTFQAATASGGTFQTVADGAGTDVSKTVAGGKYVAIDPTLFRGVRFVKLVSGATEAAGRTITIFSIPAK